MDELNIPSELRYSEQDEWVRFEDDGSVVVGVTDYAQQQLGDVVFIELPEVGTRVEKETAFGVIESVKAVSDLFAPVSGEVLAVNEALVDAPETVNDDCYGEGWILTVAPEDDGDDGLMDADAYRKHVESRSD